MPRSRSDSHSKRSQAEFPVGVPPESLDLSEEDAKVLADLKKELADQMPIDESLLIRFVRGYKTEKTRWDTTLSKLKETLEWRKKVKADSVLNEPLSDERKFFEMWPHDFHGFSKSGHPIYIEDTCHSQPADLLKHFSIEQQQLLHVQTLEMLDAIKKKKSKQTGHRTYKHLVIMDLNNLGRKHVSSSGHIKAQINIDQYFYPECLYRLYIINAPWVFRALWSMVKPWLHPLTAERIHILGSNYTESLKELIDEDNLPRYLGGACKCCPDKKTLGDLATEKYERFVQLREQIHRDLQTSEVIDEDHDHKSEQ